jgi:hypothetical protein
MYSFAPHRKLSDVILPRSTKISLIGSSTESESLSREIRSPTVLFDVLFSSGVVTTRACSPAGGLQCRGFSQSGQSGFSSLSVRCFLSLWPARQARPAARTSRYPCSKIGVRGIWPIHSMGIFRVSKPSSGIRARGSRRGDTQKPHVSPAATSVARFRPLPALHAPPFGETGAFISEPPGRLKECIRRSSVST